MTDRPITLMCDQFPTCGECGVRLAVSDLPINADADGPIFAGICPTHGLWRLQDDPNPDEDEDDEDEEDDDA